MSQKWWRTPYKIETETSWPFLTVPALVCSKSQHLVLRLKIYWILDCIMSGIFILVPSFAHFSFCLLFPILKQYFFFVFLIMFYHYHFDTYFFLRKDRKRVDPDRRRFEEELGRVGERKIIIRIYYVRIESVFCERTKNELGFTTHNYII